MRIGIFGGTFNPPHNGHKHLCECVSKELSLDKVIIIPSCQPPHKIPGSLVASEHRLKMCEIMFDDPFYEVSDLEIRRGSKSYTVETLRELKKVYPNDELFFIIGSDMLESFTRWYLWEEILKMVKLVACSREDGYVPDLSKFGNEYSNRVIYINSTPFVVSSTLLRYAIRIDEVSEQYIPKQLLEYITANNLYDDGLSAFRGLLKERLDPKRLYHSECVSESAVNLAQYYGEDIKKAAIAGLLHDVMKCASDEEHKKYFPNMSPADELSRPVWHQFSASGYLFENGIVTDREILGAIGWHTTGKSGMSRLEKIIYVADYISSDRDYPDVDVVRKLAYISLEHAILYTTRYTIDKMIKLDRPIHPATTECYNEMVLHFLKG